MTQEEINRSEILRMAEEKRITQKERAKRIGICERHLRRLLKRYRAKGAEGITSGHRGKPSNDRMEKNKRKNILNKLKENYADFGPTFASEKLLERDGIKVSKETVRQIMIAEGLHQPKLCRKDNVHLLRERRPRRTGMQRYPPLRPHVSQWRDLRNFQDR